MISASFQTTANSTLQLFVSRPPGYVLFPPSMISWMQRKTSMCHRI